MSTRSLVLPPNPSRLVEGLRDTGYDFCSALADIVDNSIDAQATDVHVRIALTPDEEIFVSVGDNGHGMNEDQLVNAMTYGSFSQKSNSALGKFGIGLKTASTAFCRRLTVVTRTIDSATVHKAVLDLDHIAIVNAWEILVEEVSDHELFLLNEASNYGQGTLIVWEKVDRLGKDNFVGDASSRKKFVNSYADKFSKHASAVFQRFIDVDDARATNVCMVINDTKIAPWDPFLTKHPGTDLVTEKSMKLQVGDQTADFLLRAYVLPSKGEFESTEGHRAAKIGNNEQGFYIYRENRLISACNWLEMYSKEPHTSLLRIDFSFDHRLDSAFKVDIKKSSLHLDDGLYAWIKDKFVSAPRRAAEARYRNSQKSQISKSAKSSHDLSNKLISAKGPHIQLASVTPTGKAPNEVAVKNKYGTIVMNVPVAVTDQPEKIAVVIVDSIDDGLLWEPCLHNQQHAIRLNTSHDYYRKIYVPSQNKTLVIQGIDSLLWALAEAELSAVNSSTIKHFKELRYEVSKLLRGLVEDLPEPDLDKLG